MDTSTYIYIYTIDSIYKIILTTFENNLFTIIKYYLFNKINHLIKVYCTKNSTISIQTSIIAQIKHILHEAILILLYQTT